MRARPVLLNLAAVACVFALAGCEFSCSIGSQNLNTDKAETEIAKGIEEQTGIASTVTCPDDVKIQKDDTFTCTAKAKDGSKATIDVTQKDDSGNISWKLRN